MPIIMRIWQTRNSLESQSQSLTPLCPISLWKSPRLQNQMLYVIVCLSVCLLQNQHVSFIFRPGRRGEVIKAWKAAGRFSSKGHLGRFVLQREIQQTTMRNTTSKVEKYSKWWWEIQQMMMRNTVNDDEKYNKQWWEIQQAMMRNAAKDDEKYNKQWWEIQ